MESSHNHATPKIVGTIAISAVMIIGIYTLILKKDPAQSSFLATSQQSTTSPIIAIPSSQNIAIAQTTEFASSETQTASTTFKDGTYTASASYRVPEGDTNTLTAKISIKNDLIVSVTTSSAYQARESARYINSFESYITGAVSGKKLGDGFYGRIGGASLTSSAFNDIIDTVTKNAKA